MAIIDSYTYAAGESSPHCMVCLGGYIYMGLMTIPGKLLKIDANDLSSYSVLTFPDDGDHRWIIDILYCSTKDKIYCLFAEFDRTMVAEVDPVTLATSDVINSSTYNTDAGSFTTDESYLYIATYGSNTTLQYDMSDWSYVTDKQVTGSTPHAIENDGTNLYVTHAMPPGRVTKILISDMDTSSQATFAAGDNTPTDDFAIVGDYIWVGLEATNGHILKIAKSDLSITVIETGMTTSCYGVFYDGTWIWALYAGTPGYLVRIDPATNDLDTFEAPCNHPCELAWDGTYFYVSSYTSPAGLYKITPPIPSEQTARALLIGKPHGSYATRQCITRDFVYI